jgi:hypothetical protein
VVLGNPEAVVAEAVGELGEGDSFVEGLAGVAPGRMGDWSRTLRRIVEGLAIIYERE